MTSFAATLVVLKVDGPPVICKTDEVGEICMSASASGSSFWGLPGLTNATFRVKPEKEAASEGEQENRQHPYGDQEFVRTGLLGFLGPVSTEMNTPASRRCNVLVLQHELI